MMEEPERTARALGRIGDARRLGEARGLHALFEPNHQHAGEGARDRDEPQTRYGSSGDDPGPSGNDAFAAV